jgi:DNA repair exonuclease SbcCD nuclease subunit
MRLVHLSDLHLGIRQFQRQTPAGLNQREADVAGVFAKTVDRIIALAPDVVLIAGDVFHNVRPPNPAILHTFTQLLKLTRALPGTIVVMVAGNHDAPRAVETGCILRLFNQLGVHVVDQEPQRLRFPDRGLSILAVPDVPGVQPVFETDPDARYNVLVLHGAMPGVFADGSAYEEPAALNVAPESLHLDRWDYCAFGHYHVFRQLKTHACYSGALEYTSADIWWEVRDQEKSGLKGKAFIEYDLERKKRTIHRLEPARAVRNLPTIDARGMTAADVDVAIAANAAAKGGIDDQIVRQVVNEIPRHVARELDHRMLRDLRRRALHYHLDTRRPELLRSLPISGGSGRRPSLTELVRDRLQSRPLNPEVDREALVALGLRYLQDAESLEATATVTPAEGA